MSTTTGKRHRATARPGNGEPSSKKKKTTTEDSQKKKTIEQTTEEHYKVIDRILGFKVLHNYPTGKAFGVSSYTAASLPFLAFPVLTRAPQAAGVLPEKLPSGDRGYFLGAADPGDICSAIVEAYMACHTNTNPKVSPWKNWEVYLFNRAYYGSPVFEKSGHQDISGLQAEILSSREWGGKNHRLLAPIARIQLQKKFLLAVYLSDFFEEKLPEGLPTGATFYTRTELSRFHERYNEQLRQNAEIQSQKLAAKINSINDEYDSEDEEEEASGDD